MLLDWKMVLKHSGLAGGPGEILWVAGVQMPAGGNVIKRTHPGSGVTVILNMDDRGGSSDETAQKREETGRRKRSEMKEGCRVGRQQPWLWLAGL